MTISNRNSSSAVQFDKVLRAFETGGFTYVDVRSQLKLILAKGASPGELIETLRRRERVEPLPPQAHEEVLRLLNDAAEQQSEALPGQADQVGEGPGHPATPESDTAGGSPSHAETLRELQDQLARQSTELESMARVHERTRVLQNAASERVTALAAELANATRSLEAEQNKNREYAKALAERSASAEAHQVRGEELLRKAKEYDVELRAALEALAGREADLAALRQEHAALARELLERNQGASQLRSDLQAARSGAMALAAELADARTLLQTEQQNVRALRQAHAEATADAQSLRAQTHDALRASEHQDAETNALRAALADRDAKLRALEQDQASVILGQESQAKTVMQAGVDLNAARARADALLLDLSSSRGATASLDAQLKRARSDLDAVRNELKSVEALAHSYLELLRTREWRRASQHSTASQPAAVAVAPRTRMAAPGVYALAAVVLVLGAIIAFFVHNATSPASPDAPVRASVARGSVIRDCPICPAMVVLPAGRFKQGANDGDSSSTFGRPRHWVAVLHPLAMSMNAVTLDEYAAFVAATGRDMQGCDIYDGAWKRDPAASWRNPGFPQTGAHPVTCVSWNDAQAYASWITSKSGHTYRLPSASEWEYAARAGSQTALPWGAAAAEVCANANVADRVAAQQFPGWSVFGCSDGWVYTAPVGSFKSNAFALNDMLGNVFQWTEDCWKEDYVGAPVDGSARLDGNCAQRELRGGSWFSNPNYVRTDYRNHFAADYRTSSVGIRLVREM